MQPVALLIESYKGKTVTHPFSNYTVVMFVQGYVTVFLGLCDSVSKERHKATTPNCVPQEGRVLHTPTETVLHNVCSEHAALFCVCVI